MRVVIVGSGLAGATLANELVGKGQDVTVLEKGNNSIFAPTDLRFVARTFGIEKTHAITLGGTTTLWHGGVMPMNDNELKVNKVGEGWPISGIELKKWYDKAIPMLLSGMNPFLSNSNIKERVRNDIDLVQIVLPLNPKTVVLDKSVKVFKNVSTLSVDLASQRIKSCSFVEGTKFVKIDLDEFVICAGGLESQNVLTKILSEHDNHIDNAGKYFIDHPMGFIGKIKFKKTFDSTQFIGRRISNEYIVRSGLAVHDEITGLNHCFYFRPTYSLDDSEDLYILKRALSGYRAEKNWFKLAKGLIHPDIAAEILISKLGLRIPTRTFSILAVTEQLPERARSVLRDQNNINCVNWYVSDTEIESVNRSLAKLLKHLNSDVMDCSFSFDKISNRLWSGCHFSGACRMSSNSKDGVVNPQLKVFGYENLFVCDGSVLPSNGYSNTGVTIVALALRLAETLMGKQ